VPLPPAPGKRTGRLRPRPTATSTALPAPRPFGLKPLGHALRAQTPFSNHPGAGRPTGSPAFLFRSGPIVSVVPDDGPAKRPRRKSKPANGFGHSVRTPGKRGPTTLVVDTSAFPMAGTRLDTARHPHERISVAPDSELLPARTDEPTQKNTTEVIAVYLPREPRSPSAHAFQDPTLNPGRNERVPHPGQKGISSIYSVPERTTRILPRSTKSRPGFPPPADPITENGSCISLDISRSPAAGILPDKRRDHHSSAGRRTTPRAGQK